MIAFGFLPRYGQILVILGSQATKMAKYPFSNFFGRIMSKELIIVDFVLEICVFESKLYNLVFHRQQFAKNMFQNLENKE